MRFAAAAPPMIRISAASPNRRCTVRSVSTAGSDAATWVGSTSGAVVGAGCCAGLGGVDVGFGAGGGGGTATILAGGGGFEACVVAAARGAILRVVVLWVGGGGGGAWVVVGGGGAGVVGLVGLVGVVVDSGRVRGGGQVCVPTPACTGQVWLTTAGAGWMTSSGAAAPTATSTPATAAIAE
jgi:hypothetical protein